MAKRGVFRSKKMIAGMTLAMAAGVGGFAMTTATTASAAFRCGTISMGHRDAGCVKAVQNALNRCGQRVDVDGAFGPATRRAVKAFQWDDGFLATDGRVGPLTKRDLYNCSRIYIP